MKRPVCVEVFLGSIAVAEVSTRTHDWLGKLLAFIT